MRKLLLPLLALAALALAAPALAKEPKQAAVCGPDDCATTTDRQGLLNLFNGNGTAPPPAAGAYYKLTMTIDVPPDAGVSPKVQWWYAPDGDAIRPVDRDPSGVTPWYPITAQGKQLLERVTKGIRPYSPPAPTSVTIGGKTVSDPASYLRLFGQKTTGAPNISKGDWQQIVFAGPVSPWTDNAVTLEYSPSANAILSGFEVTKLPAAMASRIESRSSLAGESSFPWLIAALVAVAAAAASLLFLRRLRIGRAAAKKLVFPLLALGALTVAALALSAPALAKEPKQATLCGAGGCATTDDGRTLTTLLTDEGSTPPPPPPAAFYRMTVTIDAPPDAGNAPRFDWWYVPSKNLVLRTGVFGDGQETWITPGAAATALLARTVKGIEPFAVPTPTKVTIGSREVENPASYVKLLTQQSVGKRIPNAGDWQEIQFFGPKSPWTDGTLKLSFSAKDGLLLRGGEVVTLPTSMVTKIAAGSSLGGAGNSLPWLLIGAIAFALALVSASALALRRLGGRIPRPARFQPEA